ncbi:MAG TPA: indolepyruvate oxidoreductase subunit beta [Candidatus Latescibacteria bacterium]|nr:indolepyruvate oxidoreductase subunit beta [Candidatus Latescibacterota bacterium]
MLCSQSTRDDLETTDVLIAGVGGQGILLASEILARVCLRAGYDVKKSEVHGMAQRGGSVTSHVRFGKKIYSPLIEKGRAEILLAFEKLEALRWIYFLRSGGTVIVNDHRIDPITVSSGSATYPDDIIERLRERTADVNLVDGIGIAIRAGDLRTVNVVLLGFLSEFLPINADLWRGVIGETVPQKTVDMNLGAFEKGRELVCLTKRSCP